MRWRDHVRQAVRKHFAREVGNIAVEAASEAIRNGVFDETIEQVIVDRVLGSDEGLSRFGFIMKMSVEMIDKSSPKISFYTAKQMASAAYREFCRDNQIKHFGEPGWDWSGRGAREVAYSYEIEDWEPQP